jgi:hypothetical protein
MGKQADTLGIKDIGGEKPRTSLLNGAFYPPVVPIEDPNIYILTQ